jgi:hypothetical protein
MVGKPIFPGNERLTQVLRHCISLKRFYLSPISLLLRT